MHIEHTFSVRPNSVNWAECLSQGSKEEARQWLMEKVPRCYVLSFSQCNGFLDRHYSGTNEVYSPVEDHTFTLPDEVKDWIDSEFVKVSSV
jgi:hypothetical protein